MFKNGQWAIPENIHTVQQTAFWNSEGKGGGGGGGGGVLNWNSKGLEFQRHRGVSDLGFPGGTDK